MKKYLILLLFLLVSTLSSAQPGFDPEVDDVAPIPGLILAAVAAIGVGVYKLRRNNS